MTQLFQYFKCTDFFNLIGSIFLKNKMHTKTFRKDKIMTEKKLKYLSYESS